MTSTFENTAKIRVLSYETPFFLYLPRIVNGGVSIIYNQLLITSIGPVLDFETVKSRVDKQRATDVICSITLSIIGLLTTGKA